MLGAEKLGSEHVLLHILADDSPDNSIRKVFNGAGLSYPVILEKISSGAADAKKEQKPPTKAFFGGLDLANGGDSSLKIINTPAGPVVFKSTNINGDPAEMPPELMKILGFDEASIAAATAQQKGPAKKRKNQKRCFLLRIPVLMSHFPKTK